MALQARQLAHTQRMRTPWHSPTVLPARAALRWQASGGASTPVAPAERTVQFAVEMSCGACVTAVRNALSRVDGVNTVSVDLASQTADVFGSASVESLEAALRAARRRARLIGQGVATAFGPELAASLGLDMRTLQQSLAAVAEFKGREFGQGDAVGVVRFVQVSDAATRVEASFSGLAPGARHCLAVHSFGDLTRGALSTGPVFSPDGAPAEAGFVCDFTTDASGDATVDSAALNAAIQVWDIIGRALVVHSGERPADGTGIVGAVIARSAAVGTNVEKRVCACDGTVIFDSSFRLVAPGGSTTAAALAGQSS